MPDPQSSPFYLRNPIQTSLIDQPMEEIDGHRIYRVARGPVGPDGADGQWPQAARVFGRGPAMIALATLYGLIGTCAALLLAYLIYALIRAEEF
jgi:K+-transporting ATPase KdpF subunit